MPARKYKNPTPAQMPDVIAPIRRGVKHTELAEQYGYTPSVISCRASRWRRKHGALFQLPCTDDGTQKAVPPIKSISTMVEMTAQNTPDTYTKPPAHAGAMDFLAIPSLRGGKRVFKQTTQNT